MNVYLPNLRLPSEYQEVEYIQSSGTQYIDTGYQPSSNTEVETKFNIVTFPSDSYLYGCRNTLSGSGRRTFCLGVDNYNKQLYSYVLTNEYDTYRVPSSSVSLNTIYITKQNDQSLYLNGVLQGNYTAHSSYSVGYNMYIFSGNIGGTRGNTISMKLYSMQIKDSGTLVRDFVPCYRKSDNVIGLYDLVNSVFYTNAGSGTFSKGSDINMLELKNAYIGEVIHISSDLRGATLAGLQAQGWDNIYSAIQGGGSGNYTLDSNGLSVYGTTNLYAVLYKNIPNLSNAETVELHITGYTTRVSSGYSYEYNTWLGCGLGPTAGEFYQGIYGGYLSGNTNTPHGYTGITYKRGLLGDTSYTNVAGNFDITIKINLASGLVNYQITSPVSLTSNYTLNSTQLSDVRSMKYINIPLRLYDGGNTVRLYTVELTVE